MPRRSKDAIRHNIDEARSAYCSRTFVRNFYGLGDEDAALFGRVELWGRALKRPRKLWQDGKMNRRLLEEFLSAHQYVPRRWAAAELGMELGSFDETLRLLAKNHLLLDGPSLSSSVVSRRFVSEFSGLFAATANVVFKNHNSRCRRLHAAILSELELKVKPLMCVASSRLDADADFAHDFDCLTFDGVGLGQQVSLDFTKPMSLRPDVCSVLTFAAFREVLSPLVFAGSVPALSPSIEREAAAWLEEDS